MACILPSRPSVGARIHNLQRELWIREGWENDAFPFPRSKKPFTDFLRQITTTCEESENDTFLFPRSKKPRMDFLRPYKYWTVIFSVVAALWLTTLFPLSVYAQADVSVDSRKLTIIEPAEESSQLDPAFEMIMEKLDRDLNYLLSAPVRMTPKGTAYFGVTLLTTIYLLDFDDEYLDDISSERGETSDRIYDRLNIIGSNIPEIAAGMYLLGGFLKNQTLKTKSLQGLEASALTALVAIGTGYLIGHAGPDQANDAGEFRTLTQNRSMPDLSTALSFSFAGVLACRYPSRPDLRRRSAERKSSYDATGARAASRGAAPPEPEHA